MAIRKSHVSMNEHVFTRNDFEEVIEILREFKTLADRIEPRSDSDGSQQSEKGNQ